MLAEVVKFPTRFRLLIKKNWTKKNWNYFRLRVLLITFKIHVVLPFSWTDALSCNSAMSFLNGLGVLYFGWKMIFETFRSWGGGAQMALSGVQSGFVLKRCSPTRTVVLKNIFSSVWIVSKKGLSLFFNLH